MPAIPLERFWFPRGSQVPMDLGYLRESVLISRQSSHKSERAALLRELHEVPCLILLGEPGLGKSHEAETAWEEARKSLPSDEKLLTFRLGDYEESNELKRDIFRDEVLQDWKNGSGRLHLWLDGLDEGRYHIKTIAQALGTGIKSLPVERLSLRIMCRSADWPRFLEDELKAAWQVDSADAMLQQEASTAGADADTASRESDKTPDPPKPVQVWELAPLSRENVRVWAQSKHLDSEAFLEAIETRQVTALAAKPLTLEFLIEQYAESGTLPNSRAELYERGCREMCKETNRSRQTSGAVGELSADERLAIATRIAGVAMLANRVAVSVDFDPDKAALGDIAVAKLAGGAETVRTALFAPNSGLGVEVPKRIEVTEEAVRETLRYTALFSSRGAERLGWRHQTYAEYLAARYLYVRRVSPQRAWELLCVQERIAPQLREVASWLASLQPKFFDLLLQNDPEVALRSDILWMQEPGEDTVQTARRERLSAALLSALERQDVRGLDLWRSCERLAYPGLVAQILPHLTRQNAPENLRIGALAMCAACPWHEVSDAVLGLALDEQQPERIRTYAIILAMNKGDGMSRQRLLPLARGEMGATGNLRGWALQAVWPEHLTAQGLFETLTLPGKNASTAYEHFLASGVVPGLQNSDVPMALDWVRAQEAQKQHGLYGLGNFYAERMASALVRRAWDCLDAPGITEALAALAVQRSAHYQPIFGRGAATIEI